jgi:ATP-dependent DNA helicase RecG
MKVIDRRALIVEYCREPKTLKEIMQFIGLKHRPHFIETILNPLLRAGLISMAVPDKPKSRFQKYVSSRDKS